MYHTRLDRKSCGPGERAKDPKTVNPRKELAGVLAQMGVLAGVLAQMGVLAGVLAQVLAANTLIFASTYQHFSGIPCFGGPLPGRRDRNGSANHKGATKLTLRSSKRHLPKGRS